MAVLQCAQGWRVAHPIVRRLPEIKGGRRIKELAAPRCTQTLDKAVLYKLNIGSLQLIKLG